MSHPTRQSTNYPKDRTETPDANRELQKSYKTLYTKNSELQEENAKLQKKLEDLKL